MAEAFTRELAEQTARAARLERALERQRALSRDLEKMLEDKTREMFTVLEAMKLQTRVVRGQSAANVVLESASLEDAASRMLKVLGESMGWDFAALWLVDAPAGVLRCHEIWCSRTHAPRFEALTRHATFALGAGLPGHVWACGKAAWLGELADDPGFPRAAAAKEEGLHGACGFPIRLGQKIVAVVEFFAGERREADAELLATLDAVAGQIGQALEHRRTQEALRERDMDIARRLQTSILPRTIEIAGLEVAARMLPAEDVGGDYYDIIPCEDGCWIGIGDVTGHGLGAGLVMLMLQSAVGALTRARPLSSPREHLDALNALLYDNVSTRLGRDNHVTFSLLRYRNGGELTIAGAHEDILILRRSTGRCEQIETPVTWLGAASELPFAAHEEVTTTLSAGDVMLLYTDGIIESRDPSGALFGLDRLCRDLERRASEPVATICDGVLDAARAWTKDQRDDMAVLALRYQG
jgi:serine phosphatase RsbU (regulator of sigma subunit)